MIPSIIYQLLRFIFLFGIMAFLVFCVIYKIEKRYQSPYFLDDNFKNFWHSGFWQSLVCFTKCHMKWLFLPLFFYLFFVYFEVLSEDTFSRKIIVYDNNDHINYSYKIILLPQKLRNGERISPFDKMEIIENNSKEKLVLKRNTYSKNISYSSFSDYTTFKIKPNTIFYCEDNFPENYILKEPPTVKHIRRYKDRIVWSLEVANRSKQIEN